ncbi:hypothetical protein HN51_065011 [Arachis hypogaea]
MFTITIRVDGWFLDAKKFGAAVRVRLDDSTRSRSDVQPCLVQSNSFPRWGRSPIRVGGVARRLGCSLGRRSYARKLGCSHGGMCIGNGAKELRPMREDAREEGWAMWVC